jgi:LysM repeat protein
MSERTRGWLLAALALAAVTLFVGLAVARGRTSRSADGSHTAAHESLGVVDLPGDAAVPPAAGDVHYTVAPGDTLGVIAERFGVSVEELMAGNGLADPNQLQVGQALAIRGAPAREGPALRIIPDSELVNGPAYVGFDTASEIARFGGHLAGYSESVNGIEMTGTEIVETISRDFSIGPRLLLAILEARGGWVTGAVTDATALSYPAGLADPARSGLWRQLNWLADRLNGGYYDWQTRASRGMTLADGSRLAGHPSLGPGSFALQRALAFQATEAELPGLLADVQAAYGRLFGDPFTLAPPPQASSPRGFPSLGLPFAPGDLWWMTGGPHGGWADGSAWAALDFVPEEPERGCFTSARWATAAADGVVLPGGDGQLWLDLDGDGDRRTGPVLFYMHLAEEGRVAPGSAVKAGDPLGHPSCEGGLSNATHLHLARLFDGNWLAAAGEAPFELGGWRATGGKQTYDGGLQRRDGQKREACECRTEGVNDLQK